MYCFISYTFCDVPQDFLPPSRGLDYRIILDSFKLSSPMAANLIYYDRFAPNAIRLSGSGWFPVVYVSTKRSQQSGIRFMSLPSDNHLGLHTRRTGS